MMDTLAPPRVAALLDRAGRDARLQLVFERDDGRTLLARRVHEGPLRAQIDLDPEGAEVCQAVGAPA